MHPAKKKALKRLRELEQYASVADVENELHLLLVAEAEKGVPLADLAKIAKSLHARISAYALRRHKKLMKEVKHILDMAASGNTEFDIIENRAWKMLRRLEKNRLT